MQAGWVKLHRKLLDNPRAGNPEWVALWVHLLVMASHSERDALFQGERITLKPGQFVTGRLQLSEKTGISQTNIERLLDCFESEQQIGQQKKSKGRLISILNWADYQEVDSKTDSKRTANGQQVDTNKKELKNERIKDLFDLWNQQKVVVHKNLDDRTAHQIEITLKAKSADEVAQAIRNYGTVVRGPEFYWKHKWPLLLFLKQSNAITRFYDEADPLRNFLRDKGTPPGRMDSGTARIDVAISDLRKLGGKDRIKPHLQELPEALWETFRTRYVRLWPDDQRKAMNSFDQAAAEVRREASDGKCFVADIVGGLAGKFTPPGGDK